MSWATVRLGDLVTVKGGGTPSKKVDEYWNGDIPWASVKDLKGNEIFKTVDSITELGVSNSATNVIPSGTIITATRMALGKFAITQVDMAINQDLKALFINDVSKVERNYLIRFLESISEYINGEGKGATVKGITLGFLNDIKIPLPPLEEQKRIAAILDKADAIRQKRQQAIQLADDFLRSVFLEMFGDPVTNPKGWEVKPLNALVSKLGDGLHGTPSYDLEGKYYFVNGNNLINGKIITNDKTKKVNEEEYQKYKKDLNDNTMLVSINGTIGKVAFYDREQIVLGKSACYFNLIPDAISPNYLYSLIQSNYFLHYVNSIVTGSTIKNVSLKSMREFPIPIPSKDLQNKFEAIVENVASLKNKLNESGEFTENNFNSISQKAFSGEL